MSDLKAAFPLSGKVSVSEPPTCSSPPTSPFGEGFSWKAVLLTQQQETHQLLEWSLEIIIKLLTYKESQNMNDKDQEQLVFEEVGSSGNRKELLKLGD